MRKLSSIKLSLASAILIVGFSGCSTAIKLAEFKPATLPKGTYSPTPKDLKAQKNRVVLMQFKESSKSLVNSTKLGDIVSRYINNKLPSAGSVDIVKYADDTTLTTGINPSQLSKQLNMDIKSAQYLITGEVNDATFDYKYRRKEATLLVKNGQRVYSPPTHNYESCTKGNITIFELPALKQIKDITLKGCEYNQVNAWKYKKSNKIDTALVKEGAREATKESIYSLNNFFATKGYILEKKVNGDKIIVKTSLTKAFGAKEGEDVDIYSGDTIIGKGEISDQIMEDGCWVIIDKLNNGATVKSGDYIKIKYKKKGFFG